MTTRDRTLLLVLASVALFGGFWFLALAPRRSDAKALDTKLAAAQQRLQTAQAAAATAATAKQRYSRDYAAVARLGEAVPSDDETATLLYQLQSAAHGSKVDMRSFELGAASSTSSNSMPPASNAGGSTGSTASAAATQTAAATLPPGASVGTAGFPTMPFQFGFQGSFDDMESLLNSVQGFVRVNGENVSVSGRLLTVDGISLVPQDFPKVKATISATAFILPDSQASIGSTATGKAATAPSDQSASTTNSTSTSATGVAP